MGALGNLGTHGTDHATIGFWKALVLRDFNLHSDLSVQRFLELTEQIPDSKWYSGTVRTSGKFGFIALENTGDIFWIPTDVEIGTPMPQPGDIVYFQVRLKLSEWKANVSGFKRNMCKWRETRLQMMMVPNCRE